MADYQIPRTLTVNMRKFCEYLIADEKSNGQNAAISAGYSAKTARSRSSQLLARDDVQGYLEHLRAERMKRVKFDADYVLKKLGSISEADPAEILDDEGNYKPLKQWPVILRKMIRTLELGENGIPRKVVFVDPARMLEMLGKHTAVKAFSDVVEHKSDPELVKALREARERVQQPS